MVTTNRTNWSYKDNKQYRGHIDRVNVALSEEWEIEYFVDAYLKTRNYAVNEKNRHIVLNALNDYNGKAPIKRDDLNAFLDQKWKK